MNMLKKRAPPVVASENSEPWSSVIAEVVVWLRRLHRIFSCFSCLHGSDLSVLQLQLSPKSQIYFEDCSLHLYQMHLSALVESSQSRFS
jgi:hypothetical protein